MSELTLAAHADSTTGALRRYASTPDTMGLINARLYICSRGDEVVQHAAGHPDEVKNSWFVPFLLWSSADTSQSF